MNLNQKEFILTKIEDILSFDFDKLIIENNKTDNVEDILYGDFKVVDFKTHYRRVFEQLKFELEEGLGLILPNIITTGNEFGTIDLYNEINLFFSYFKDFNSRNNAYDILRKFVYYQVFHGFWDKSSVRLHRVEGVKLKEAEERLELISKDLQARLGQFNALNGAFKTSQELIEESSTKYDEKLIEIELSEKKIQENANQIDYLLGKCRETDEEMSDTLKEASAELLVIKEDRGSYEKDYSEKLADFDSINKRIDVLETQNKELNVNLTVKYEFIKSKEEEINRLIGLAADGALGYKFNERKDSLGTNAIIWAISTGVSSILAVIWVYLAFTKFSADLGIPWLNLIVNTIKTSPVWFLVGFCISQYKREREYQEQYAFKSAIAMTITSYSDMLSDNKQEEISIKEALLLKAVNNIYEKPTVAQEKVNVTEKSLEQAKGLISSAVDLLKNVRS